MRLCSNYLEPLHVSLAKYTAYIYYTNIVGTRWYSARRNNMRRSSMWDEKEENLHFGSALIPRNLSLVSSTYKPRPEIEFQGGAPKKNWTWSTRQGFSQNKLLLNCRPRDHA